MSEVDLLTALVKEDSHFSSLAAGSFDVSLAGIPTGTCMILTIYGIDGTSSVTKISRSITPPEGWVRVFENNVNGTTLFGLYSPRILVLMKFKEESDGDSMTINYGSDGTTNTLHYKLFPYENVREDLPISNFCIYQTPFEAETGNTRGFALPDCIRVSGPLSAYFAIVSDHASNTGAITGPYRNTYNETMLSGADPYARLHFIDRAGEDSKVYNLAPYVEVGSGDSSGMTLNGMGQELTSGGGWMFRPTLVSELHAVEFEVDLEAGEDYCFGFRGFFDNVDSTPDGHGYFSVVPPEGAEFGSFIRIDDNSIFEIGDAIGDGFDEIGFDRALGSGANQQDFSTVYGYFTAPVSGTYTFRIGPALENEVRVFTPTATTAVETRIDYIGLMPDIDRAPMSLHMPFPESGDPTGVFYKMARNGIATDTGLSTSGSGLFVGFELVHYTQPIEPVRLMTEVNANTQQPRVTSTRLATTSGVGSWHPQGNSVNAPRGLVAAQPVFRINNAPSRYYCEFTLGASSGPTTPSNDIGILVAQRHADLSSGYNSGGYRAGGTYFYASNGTIYRNNATATTTAATFTTDDVIGVLIDVDEGITFYKNGTLVLALDLIFDEDPIVAGFACWASAASTRRRQFFANFAGPFDALPEDLGVEGVDYYPYDWLSGDDSVIELPNVNMRPFDDERMFQAYVGGRLNIIEKVCKPRRVPSDKRAGRSKLVPNCTRVK